MFWETFLNILAVVGIVAVSAFVIVFLCDLFISILDDSNGIFFKRHKTDKKEEETASRPTVKQEEAKPTVVVVKEEPKVEVKEEVKPEPAPVIVIKKEEAPAPEKENLEDIIAEVSAKTKAEIELEEKQQKLIQENEELARQIEELRVKIAMGQDKIEKLESKEPEVKTIVETVKVPAGKKEDILARLEVLKQRLKENEKELSINRKEYIPLRRVNITLDSDKKKLRRKEAIVAKRKVVLYGVNNYVDIDEEKAKELQEELELLEGLRLSVQHCEEVMEKNKDRYPILERANNFLTKNQEELKSDIAELEAELEAIEEAEQEDDSEE